MNDLLDDAVRGALTDFFDAAPPPGATPTRASEPDAGARARRPSPRAVGFLAGLTAAAGVAAVVVVNRTDGNGASQPASPVTSTTTPGTSPRSVPTSSPSSPPELLPTVLPEGVAFRSYTPRSQLDDSSESQVFGMLWVVLGRRAEDGTVRDKIDVYVSYGRIFTPAVGAGYTRESLTIAGVPGEVVRHHESGETFVEYQWGEQAVIVRSASGDDPAVFDAMVQLANGVTVDEAGAELTGDVPVGFEVLTEGPWHAEADNSEPARASYADDRGVTSIDVSFETAPPPDFQYWYMMDDLAETTVRGHVAYVSHRDDQTFPLISLMWLERPDLMIVVQSHDVDVEALRAAAESLGPVSADEWDQLQAEAASDTGSEAPPTTAIVSTETVA